MTPYCLSQLLRAFLPWPLTFNLLPVRGILQALQKHKRDAASTSPPALASPPPKPTPVELASPPPKLVSVDVGKAQSQKSALYHTHTW
jgi:hypothetical protein